MTIGSAFRENFLEFFPNNDSTRKSDMNEWKSLQNRGSLSEFYLDKINLLHLIRDRITMWIFFIFHYIFFKDIKNLERKIWSRFSY